MPARKPSSRNSKSTKAETQPPETGRTRRGASGEGELPAPAAAPAAEGAGRAGTVADRRTGVDRRHLQGEVPTGLERRRSAGRRLSDFTRSAEEGELTQEQFLFLMAIDGFKKANDVMFPTWTDVLEIVRLLGYRKTMPSEITLRSGEDWREPPFGTSGVRTDRQMMRDREARAEAQEAAKRDAA